MSYSWSGAMALADGLRAGGVRVVTAYPGSPATAVVQALLASTRADEVTIEWSASEKVAAEVALGAALAGIRSAVILKGVGLNVAMDPLQAANLTGVPASLVVLVGDDPGAPQSQNEQDSRYLVRALELPGLEPRSPAEAAWAAREACRLSEQHQMPVCLRFTRRLTEAIGPVCSLEPLPAVPVDVTPPLSIGWHSTAATAVAYHDRLHRRLRVMQRQWEEEGRVEWRGDGKRAVLLVGAIDLLRPELEAEGWPVRWVPLGVCFPLPERRLWQALAGVDEVLVVEETDPFVEEQLAAAAQRVGSRLRIGGRGTGYLPAAGPVTEDHLREAICCLLDGGVPHWQEPAPSLHHRTFCEGCPYELVMNALQRAIRDSGRRVAVTAEPGCSVLAAYLPYQLLTAKYCLGSALSVAVGMAMGSVYDRVVALCGDSAFFHSGINALLSAVQNHGNALIIVLDNASTALTGQQPHPGSGWDARGRKVQAPAWQALLPACGVTRWQVISAWDEEALYRAFQSGLGDAGLQVVVAQGPCILLPEAPARPRWREVFAEDQ